MISNVVATLALVSVTYAAVFTVKVGEKGLVYNPSTITAQKGDIVNFQFVGSPGNHSVSQSAFDKPCEELSGGFDSGYVPVPANFTGAPAEWNLTVSDASKPIWFYCKQPLPKPHCMAGMVGAINPPSTGNTLEAFANAAKALGSFPVQSSGAMSGVGAAATAPPSPLAATSSNTGSPSATTIVASTGKAKSAATVVSVTLNGVWIILGAAIGTLLA